MMPAQAIAGAVLIATLCAWPAHASRGALAGAGSASTLSCTTGPIVIEGVNPSASVWIFHVTAENDSSPECADATSTVIGGTWNPATGGVIATETGTLSLGPVPAKGTPTGTSISICFVSTPVCYSGSVTVTRA